VDTDNSPLQDQTERFALRRTMLAPVAYSEAALPALRLARSSRLARRAAICLFVGLFGASLLVTLAPWQQSVTGSGTVVAFAPLERQQTIEAPIKGRIVRWGDDVFENARLAKGQLIAEIQDLDESYTDRLQQQLGNSQQTVLAAQQQGDASLAVQQAANLVIGSYEAQVRAYRSVKTETIAAQDAYIEMAEKKVLAESEQLAEYQAALPQLEAEFERLEKLFEAGNIALQKVQEVERKLSESKAKVKRGEAYVAAAKAELEGKTRERAAKIQKAQVDIDYAEAALQKAQADVGKAESDVAKARQEFNKAEKEVLEMEVKVSRQNRQLVTAPFDGIVVRITANLGSGIVKEGDPLCMIVPDTVDRAAQIWLDGNDAPLVQPGRHVRLQFEGWPAIQFAGWPSVAVGTFGGQVVSIDATDDGKGKFRALVRPDPDDAPWPSDRFLRQGVRTNGWVLLNQVPLWYEVWRQLNGFPPVVSVGEPGDDSKTKPPKPPK
jgi:multidrug resistance efflux pump